MKNRFKYSIIALTVMLVIGFGGWLGSHYLMKPAKRPQVINITAVGDSLTQGVGDPDDRGGYVYLISKKIKKNSPSTKVTAANFGIAGETSKQIDKRVNTGRRLRSQIRHSNMIVMTFGGNDLLQFLRKNMLTSNNDKMNVQLSKFEQVYSMQIQRLINHVRQQNPAAKIFVFGIYNPVYVYLPQVKFINQAVNDTNKMTKQVIDRQKNTFFVPISNELSDGQYQTRAQHKHLEKQAAKQPNFANNLTNSEILGLFGGTTTSKNNLISTTDHFHPNKRGYQIMTNKLYEAMKRHWPK